MVAAAADYFFDRRWKAVLWSLTLAAIPIERARVNRRSADMAAELLADGWNLVIFPEGGRSPDGWAQQFRGGRRLPRPAYRGARGPGLPARHPPRARQAGGSVAAPPGGSGTENRGGLLRRAEVTVMFGPPLTPAEGEDARRFGARIERAVAAGRRDGHRLVDGPPPSRPGRCPLAARTRGSPWRRAWALGPGPHDAAVEEARPWPPP